MGNADLPSLSSRDVIRAFERLGWAVASGRGKGSHTVLQRAGRATLTIPQQGDVKRALLAKQIKAGGLTNDEFKAAL